MTAHLSRTAESGVLVGRCSICNDQLVVPNKGLGRATLAAWESRHQHPRGVPVTGLPSRLSPEDAAELRRLVEVLERADRQHATAAAYAHTRLVCDAGTGGVHADERVSALADASVDAYMALRGFVSDLRGQWYRDEYAADTGSAEVET